MHQNFHKWLQSAVAMSSSCNEPCSISQKPHLTFLLTKLRAASGDSRCCHRPANSGLPPIQETSSLFVPGSCLGPLRMYPCGATARADQLGADPSEWAGNGQGPASPARWLSPESCLDCLPPSSNSLCQTSSPSQPTHLQTRCDRRRSKFAAFYFPFFLLQLIGILYSITIFHTSRERTTLHTRLSRLRYVITLRS